MPLLSWIVSNVILALGLALAAWVAQRWLARPGLAHVLWVLVLAKLVTPPLVDVPVGQSPPAVNCALGTCGCEHHSPTQTFLRDTLPWLLVGVWSAGVGGTVWIAWRRWVRFRLLTAHASAAPPEWQSLAERVASDLSIRCPEVLVVPGRLPPLVLPGLRQPRLLLPADLLDQLDASQRTALLLHELVHIRRGDHWLRLFEFAVGAVYWWLPLVGSVGRQLRACEEACCDLVVVGQLPDARRDYARLLLDVIDFTGPSARAVPQATAMSAKDLETRLRSILDPTRGTRRTWLDRAIALGLAGAILPCQLHYDFAGPQNPASSLPVSEPAVESSPATTGDGPAPWIKGSCGCPS